MAAGGSGLARVRDRVRPWLEGAGLQGAEVDEVLIAVGEACANAVEHSGAQSADGQAAACIECVCDAAGVRIVVSDRGTWKQPDTGVDNRRGRGRLLMANLVDRMSIEPGPQGTTVELVKARRDLERSARA
jgi:anti-sigma regulatory factor (Ser/Thr protein kinase)